MKSLTNSEIPSSNPLYEACSGFQVAICYCELPMILKIVLKAGHDMYKSTLYVHWRKSTRNNFDATLGTIFRISSAYKEASRNFDYFSLS
jgi:hypothetical protein